MNPERKPHGGGKRKDRCFRIYMTMPDGATEDEVMDFLEDAIVSACHNMEGPDIDPDTVSVKRLYPLYSEQK